ncbi:MAG: C40 family peptidase [Lachnospiraceae bacterium]|nr:C40 family peptidase [Lachnospiraceae bacterium]
MIGNTKKYLAIFTAFGVFVCSGQVLNIKANEYTLVTEGEAEAISQVVYDDSNVSISSALDRYIAFNSNSALNDILGVEEEPVESEADEDKAEEKNEDEDKAEEKDEEKVKNYKVVSADYIDFSNKAIVTASGQVNIRKSADINSNKVGIINGGGLVTVVEKGSEWSHITSGNCDGYIKNEFLAFGNDAKTYAENNLQKVVVINATTLRLRAQDNEQSECLTLLTGGEEYGIIKQGNGWTYIEVDDSLSGYVKNDYVSVSYRTSKAIAVIDDSENDTEQETTETTTEEKTTENVTTTEAVTTTEEKTTETVTTTEEKTTEAATTTEEKSFESSDTTEATTQVQTTEEQTTQTEEETTAAAAPAPPVNANAGSVVNYALQYVGNPYAYGGSSLTDGTDCSGFTMSVYSNFGVSLPHSSSSQANCGTEVGLSEVQPGDLIFYKNGGSSIGHVALYIGGGQVVHSSTESTGIIVSNMYYSTPCKATRVY